MTTLLVAAVASAATYCHQYTAVAAKVFTILTVPHWPVEVGHAREEQEEMPPNRKVAQAANLHLW